MNLKEQILNLKSQGIKNNEISKTLNCAPSTISYHLNPRTRKKYIPKPKISPYITKEISVDIKSVNWKHAEAICNARLIELGYETFHSFTDNSEIDVIAILNDEIIRIQIKSFSPKNIDKPCNIHFERTVGTTKYAVQPYTKIDWLLIYDGTNIYKINSSEINKDVSLRYTIPKNNQIQNIKMAKDYIF